MLTTRRLLLAVGFLVAVGSIAWAARDGGYGRYHALVIGIKDYQQLPVLETPINDASAVADLLRRDYGFSVDLLLNPTRYDMIRAINTLRARLGSGDNLLIYYAGHGVIDEETGEGFWLPVDAEPEIQAEWVPLNTVTNNIKAMRAKHVLVVADSCYSGTLTRAAPAGLKTDSARAAELDRLAAKRSRTALVSGGLEPVSDGGGDGHSIFARAFLNALRANRTVLDAHSLFTAIRRPVIVNAAQTPEYADIRMAGHDGGEFLFVPSAGQPKPAAAGQQAPATDRSTLDLAFWESVQRSDDPAAFKAYLRQFPDGTFAPLARLRLDALKGAAKPTPTEPKVAAVPRPAPPPVAEDAVAATGAWIGEVSFKPLSLIASAVEQVVCPIEVSLKNYKLKEYFSCGGDAWTISGTVEPDGKLRSTTLYSVGAAVYPLSGTLRRSSGKLSPKRSWMATVTLRPK